MFLYSFVMNLLRMKLVFETYVGILNIYYICILSSAFVGCYEDPSLRILVYILCHSCVPLNMVLATCSNEKYVGNQKLALTYISLLLLLFVFLLLSLFILLLLLLLYDCFWVFVCSMTRFNSLLLLACTFQSYIFITLKSRFYWSFNMPFSSYRGHTFILVMNVSNERFFRAIGCRPNVQPTFP
jgi:hypothetical protein